MFIDAYLALCSSVSVGAVTEFNMIGYACQPISFAKPVNGFSRNATSWTFGVGYGAPPIAGRAIFDAPSGGNLLLALPHAVSKLPASGPVDAGDVGDITMFFTALAPYASGDAFTGLIAAGSVVGSTYDVTEIIGTASSANVLPAGVTAFQLSAVQYRYTYAQALSVGPGQIAINRGVLQLQARAEGVE